MILFRITERACFQLSTPSQEADKTKKTADRLLQISENYTQINIYNFVLSSQNIFLFFEKNFPSIRNIDKTFDFFGIFKK